MKRKDITKYIFTVVITLLFSIPSYSADQPSEPKNFTIDYSQGVMSIKADNSSLVDIFTAITEKTGAKFIYDKSGMADKKTTIQLKDLPLQDAIKELLKKCDIKNYSTKLGEDPSKSIEQVEIFAPPASSGSTSPAQETPYREEAFAPLSPEPEVSEPEPAPEEEPVEDKSKDYKPSTSKSLTTEKKSPPKEKEKEKTEKKEEAKPTSGSRTYTYPGTTGTTQQTGTSSTIIPSTQIKDSSNEYYPPGSKSTQKQNTNIIKDNQPIRDMSDEYHPPGYIPQYKEVEDRSNNYSPPGYVPSNEPVRDMSDDYHPPGYKH